MIELVRWRVVIANSLNDEGRRAIALSVREPSELLVNGGVVIVTEEFDGPGVTDPKLSQF